MDSLFDPCKFIDAERAEQSQLSQLGVGSATVARPTPNPQKSAIPTEGQALLSQQSQLSQPQPTKKSIWQVGPGLLACLSPPPRVAKLEWDRLVRTTNWIADDWADAAEASGWNPLEFFGCSPDPYRGTFQDGLIKLVIGMAPPATVTAIHSDHAEITVQGGVVLRYRHFGPRGQVFLWDADWMKEGP